MRAFTSHSRLAAFALASCAFLIAPASAGYGDDYSQKVLGLGSYQGFGGVCPPGISCAVIETKTSIIYTSTKREHSTCTRTVTATPTECDYVTTTLTLTTPVLIDDCTTTSVVIIPKVTTYLDVETITTTTTLEEATITLTEYATQTTRVVRHCTSTIGYVEAPSVYLPSPTAIIGNLYGAERNADDETFSVQVPFPITLWGITSDRISVSTNGVLSLDDELQSRVFDNTALPTDAYPETSAFIFWDDLMIFKGTQQGIYYQISGPEGGQEITFEYYLSKFNNPGEYYHFQASYRQEEPNVLHCTYLQVSDLGVSATIGAQGPGGQFLQYSFNQPIVVSDTYLRMDTDSRTITVALP